MPGSQDISKDVPSITSEQAGPEATNSKSPRLTRSQLGAESEVPSKRHSPKAKKSSESLRPPVAEDDADCSDDAKIGIDKDHAGERFKNCSLC